MKTEYYSSLPNEKKQPTSPVFASSSITLAVASVSSSAKKMARSIISPLKRGGALEEDKIPVIYFPDEDSRTVRRKVPAFIDPYSFVPTADEDCCGGMKSTEFKSSTSVIPVRLFAEAADGSVEVSAATLKDDSSKLNDDSIFDPVVTFECPVFSLGTANSKKDDDDTTSLQLSEAIRSINIKDDDTKSVREKLRDMKEARSIVSTKSEFADMWEDPTLTWKGFTRSSSWRKYEWGDDAK